MKKEKKAVILIELEGKTVHYHRTINKEGMKMLFATLLDIDKELKEVLKGILFSHFELVTKIPEKDLPECLRPEKIFISTDEGEHFKELRLVGKGGDI